MIDLQTIKIYFLKTLCPDEWLKLSQYDNVFANYLLVKNHNLSLQSKLSELSLQIKVSEDNFAQIVDELSQVSEENEKLLDKITEVKDENAELKEQNETILDYVVSEIDSFCETHYTLILNKVYQQKRKFKDTEIQVFLNQLITPEAFEVQKFKKNIFVDDNVYDYVFKITDKVSKHTTWTSDDTTCNQSDFYYYPEETLKLKKADCEDISNVIASCYPKQMGVGYGFYNSKGYSEQDKGFGHAFNVFVWSNELYIAEGTANRAVLHRYEPNNSKEQYHLLFVITKDFTYKCTNENIEFGYLVNW